MPFYDYKCPACGLEWEERQGITDLPLKHCPQCAHESPQRMIGGNTSFTLKGSGWAKDGYSK